MKIIIAGGAGFLGAALEKFFLAKNNEVKILTRSPKKTNDLFWDAKTLGKWQSALETSDVLINLTGKSVDCRYTEENKKEILYSRINSTGILQEAISKCSHPPKIWLNAASATIYTHSETHLNTEENGVIGDDFSMNICKQWEAEFLKIKNENTRKVALRTSIVMGNEGGAFPELKMITKMGLGGIQGKGNQFVSWIHLQDFCAAVEYIIDHENIVGAINVTAPYPLTNKEMMQKLRAYNKIPLGIPSPTWLLEIAAIFMRTETELLLKSRNVYPQKLIEAGFIFNHPSFENALKTLM